jgi:hypothetical protein
MMRAIVQDRYHLRSVLHMAPEVLYWPIRSSYNHDTGNRFYRAQGERVEPTGT